MSGSNQRRQKKIIKRKHYTCFSFKKWPVIFFNLQKLLYMNTCTYICSYIYIGIMNNDIHKDAFIYGHWGEDQGEH